MFRKVYPNEAGRSQSNNQDENETLSSDFHLTEALQNQKPADAKVESQTNFHILTKESLILVFPRAADKRTNSLVANIFEFIVKAFEIIEKAGHTDLLDMHLCSVNGTGYQDSWPCVVIGVKKVLEAKDASEKTNAEKIRDDLKAQYTPQASFKNK